MNAALLQTKRIGLAAVGPVAVGSAQALEEHVTGGPRPEKAERDERPPESVKVTRAPFAGTAVTPGRRQVHLSYHPDEDGAPAMAHGQWRHAIVRSDVGWNPKMPEDSEQVDAYVRPGDAAPRVPVSPDPGQHTEWLGQLADMGLGEAFLHHVGNEQETFTGAFGERVLPSLKEVAP